MMKCGKHGQPHGILPCVFTNHPTLRTTSLAGECQMMMSEATRTQAGLGPDGMETRRLELKGKSEPVDAWVITVSS